MKIVNIIGGLGNQMFQYAFALSLKEKFPSEDIYIDITHYNYLFLKQWKTSNLHNGFELETIFPNANLPKAKVINLLKVTWYVPNYWLSRIVRKILPHRKTEFIQVPPYDSIFDSEVYERTGDCYYEGYWQSISYFIPIRNKILETFKHPKPNSINLKYINDISSNNSVGIHIRRGDYIFFDDYRGICDLNYYSKAIKEILKDDNSHVFYIFSNDTEWCEKNICPLLQENTYHLVIENKGVDSCWDMFLMTYCKDLIIANSSFSWWGAFLNTRRGRIISPSKWNNRDVDADYWDKKWIRI